MTSCRAFIVQVEADHEQSRMIVLGRLEDGQSFGAMDQEWSPAFWVRTGNTDAALGLLAGLGIMAVREGTALGMGAEALSRIRIRRFRDWKPALGSMEAAGIPVWEGDRSFQVLWLRDHLTGPLVDVEGDFRPGRLVDVAIHGARFAKARNQTPFPLRSLSFDLETDVAEGTIRAASLACGSRQEVHLLVEDKALGDSPDLPAWLICHRSEASLLAGFLEAVQKQDPDIITGWNILDFDLPVLAQRCKALRIPLSMGRTRDPAWFLPSTGSRSGALHAPGRQVLDALRLVRSGGEHFDDYRLDSVARAVLGRGKLVDEEGAEKIAALDRLYKEDPEAFARYCMEDSRLVLDILAAMGLEALTIHRSVLTCTSLDMAWTSIASFEQLYGMELRNRGLVEPRADHRHDAGSPGGTVLEPRPLLARMVMVFDYRSLYPSVIRTFNVDPLGWQEARGLADTDCIRSPNGARFSRSPAILPQFTDHCFESRLEAIRGGDKVGAHVYKILMNSFYGVLGASGCRYGRRELAGAITSAGAWCLRFARDWFEARGYHVLYGDTDSVFVQSDLDPGSDHGTCLAWAESMAARFDQDLGRALESEFRCTSRIQLRFDKAYRHFLIPRIRGGMDTDKGRAKGYAGLQILPDGRETIDIKGMEAVRSDSTPLARRVQKEVLGIVFGDDPERSRLLEDYLAGLVRDLKAGRLDRELVYTRRLRQAPSTYTRNTPPHVRAARLAGMEGKGRISYLITRNGPEPEGLTTAPIDHDHYLESQILPLARSIGELAGFDADVLAQAGLAGRQMDLFGPSDA